MPESIMNELWGLVPTAAYFITGTVLFIGGVVVLEKVSPFSIRKEIEEDHNNALAILVGAGMVSLALIMAAAIK